MALVTGFKTESAANRKAASIGCDVISSPAVVFSEAHGGYVVVALVKRLGYVVYRTANSSAVPGNPRSLVCFINRPELFDKYRAEFSRYFK